jgi:hypothetical protein
MKITHGTSQDDHLQRSLVGMESEKEKKEPRGEGPIYAGQQTAAKVTNSMVQGKSCMAVSASFTEQLTGSELTWGLDSLFHRFSMPQAILLFLESSLFF